MRIAGTDPDYAQRNLFNAIQQGDYPRWTVFIEVMTDEQRIDWEQCIG